MYKSPTSLQDTPDVRRIKWTQKWLPFYFNQHIFIPVLYCLVSAPSLPPSLFYLSYFAVFPVSLESRPACRTSMSSFLYEMVQMHTCSSSVPAHMYHCPSLVSRTNQSEPTVMVTSLDLWSRKMCPCYL